MHMQSLYLSFFKCSLIQVVYGASHPSWPGKMDSDRSGHQPTSHDADTRNRWRVREFFHDLEFFNDLYSLDLSFFQTLAHADYFKEEAKQDFARMMSEILSNPPPEVL